MYKNYWDSLHRKNMEKEQDEIVKMWQDFPDIYDINTEDSIVQNQKQLLKVLLFKTFEFIVKNYGGIDEDSLALIRQNASEKLEQSQYIHQQIEKLCTYIRNFQKQTYTIDLNSFLWFGSKQEEEIRKSNMESPNLIRFSNVKSIELIPAEPLDGMELEKQLRNKIEAIYKDVLENDPQIKEMLKKPIASHDKFDTKEVEKFKYSAEFYNVYFQCIYSDFIPQIEDSNVNLAYGIEQLFLYNFRQSVKRLLTKEDESGLLLASLLSNMKSRRRLVKFISYLTDIHQFKDDISQVVFSLKTKLVHEYPSFNTIFHRVKQRFDAYLDVLNQEEYKQLIKANITDSVYDALISMDQDVENKDDLFMGNSKLYTLLKILSES